MRLEAVLWDLDGTLLESSQSIRETMNAVLAERGYPTFAAGELRQLVGKPLRDILAVKCPDAQAIEPMALRYRQVYNERAWVTVRLHDGMQELLHELTGWGLRQGVVTSKGEEEADVLLADLGLRHHFDAVVGDDDVRPLKPHPAPVLEAARRLVVPPGACAMVGDTPYDIEAWVRAGARAASPPLVERSQPAA
ncbi:MAG TPA: HAD family hydrolase, partial [Candidatus Thermoplasmatota archaeon]|nr:HAD family hydrolase [Candidatus Thermoplasmatota archaeon]